MIAMPPPKVRVEHLQCVCDDFSATEMVLWRGDFTLNGALVAGLVLLRDDCDDLTVLFPAGATEQELSLPQQDVLRDEFLRIVQFLEGGAHVEPE